MVAVGTEGQTAGEGSSRHRKLRSLEKKLAL